MRQQINLVNLALLPPKPFFQFKSMMISLAVIMVFLSAISVLFRFSLNGYLGTIAQVERNVSLKQEQLKALEQKASLRQKDPAVAARLARLQDERQRLQQMAGLLRQGGIAEEKRSPAAYLYALARQASPGIWLTWIELHGDRVSLQGGASDAAAVPVYLAQIMRLPEFKGQRFAGFELGSLSSTAVAPVSGKALAFRLESISEGKEKP